MKILIMTDSHNLPTGLARVGREIALALQKGGHEVGYLGWFQRTDIPMNPLPGIQFWFTNNNHYGQDALDGVVNAFQPEVVLTIGDMWNLWYITDPNLCKTRRFFQWCSYVPADGEPLNGGLPPGMKDIVEDVDIPVAYTEYARQACLKTCMDQETRRKMFTIYHGVDTNLFKPPDPAARRAVRERYGIGDKFVFLTVCRNQSRKNVPEMFRAWKAFIEDPEFAGKAIFWPHMHFEDPMGWRIGDILDILSLRNNSIMYYDQVAYSRSEFHLMPDKELAELYQIADAFILLSGEGFGLPTFEAMATGLPCILLDYAASSELGADGRAEMVPVHGSMTWTGSHLTQRPIPDIERVKQSMAKVYRDADYRQSIARKGHEFATKFTWEAVGKQWSALFNRQEVPFMAPVEMEVVS